MSVKSKVVRSGLDNDGPAYDPGIDCSYDPDTGVELASMTKQSFVDECDINTIMRRYESTGAFPDHINARAGSGQYGDFSLVTDYQEALNIVIEAEQMFEDLPARIRDRFGNDPDKLLQFLADGKNQDEAMELGLVPRPEAPPAPESGSQEQAPPPPPPPPKPPFGGSGSTPPA